MDSEHNQANQIMNKYFMFDNHAHIGMVHEKIPQVTGVHDLTPPTVWNFIQYTVFTIEQMYGD